MKTRFIKFLRRAFFLLSLASLVGLFLPRLITSLYSFNRIYQTDDAPAKQVAIVFGAGLRRDGTPTAVLQDRVKTAVSLYFSGKVEKLLMSGADNFRDHSEPEAMRQYAISLGVPSEVIILDPAGSRTYDTCYRAKAVFKADNVILVTQQFHLPRALFLCNALGIQAVGVEANNNQYRRVSLTFWNIRELFATTTAFVDILFGTPQPMLGEPAPLFVE